MSLILICYLASKLLRQRHKEFLSKINTNKSHDVDNLPAPILCLCAKELSIPLAYLFNLSLKSVKVPDLWKSANITPVHQSDSKELVKKNRLISLLPITAECLEQIVQTAVYKHISRYLTEWQHGFCQRQIVWNTAGSYPAPAGCGPWRRVSNRRNILWFLQGFWKCESSTFITKALQFWNLWITPAPVWKLLKQPSTKSGAGWSLLFLGWSYIWSLTGFSLLGPLFLVIFISDLPEVVLPGNTIALHADDCKCSRIIDAADDQDLFQED